jgi:hypothetical protein
MDDIIGYLIGICTFLIFHKPIIKGAEKLVDFLQK